MDGDGTLSLDLLRRNHAFVRAIARAVLIDPDAADDVVQETWLAALRHEGPTPSPARSWLARIARNLALNRRRAGLRRAAREQIAASSERVPSVGELAEWEEERRRVVDAVNALDEPLRTTTLLRYLHDRSEADVAAELGVPLETVRTRLRRARDILRRRLGDGDPERTARGLAALAGIEAKSLTAMLGTGVIAMGMKTWIAATVIGAAIVGTWFVAANREEVVAARSEVVAVSVTAVAPAEVVAATREPTATDGSGAQRAMRTSIRGRCVDRAKSPIAGVPIALDGGTEVVTTAADGRFELPLADLDEPKLMVLHHRSDAFVATHWNVRVEPAARVNVADLELVPAAKLVGIVVDDRGAPVAGAEVVVAPTADVQVLAAEGPPDERRFGRTFTRADGRFDLCALPEAWMRVSARADGFFWAHSGIVAASASSSGAPIELRLTAITPDLLVRGRVVDDAGIAIAGATVAIESRMQDRLGSYGGGQILVTGTMTRIPGEFLTTADGSFAVAVTKMSETSVFASTGDGRFAQATDVAPGGPPLELRLTAGPLIPVRIVDASTGDPVRASRLSISAGIGRPMSLQLEPVDGVLWVPAPAAVWSLAVTADGYELARRGKLPAAGPAEGFVVELTPQAVVTGRVVAGGAPVANARVSLHAYRPLAETLFLLHDFVTEVGNEVATVRTDAEGKYRLGLVRYVFDGYSRDERLPCFAVRVIAPGHATALRSFASYEAIAAAGTLDFALEQGGAVEGRVTNEHGEPVLGAVVAGACRDADIKTMRTDENGAFRFEHLAPGAWEFQVRSQDLDPKPPTMDTRSDGRRFKANCTVMPERTSTCDLTFVTPMKRNVVRGRVLLDAAPVPALWVGLNAYGTRPPFLDMGRDAPTRTMFGGPGRIHDMQGAGASSSTSGAIDGRFELASEYSGVHLLELQIRPMPFHVWIEIPLALSIGVTERDVSLRTGTIHVVSKLAKRARVTWIAWLPDEVTWLGIDYLDVAGTTLDLRAPEGRTSVYVGDAIYDLDVRAGETTEVVVGGS